LKVFRNRLVVLGALAFSVAAALAPRAAAAGIADIPEGQPVDGIRCDQMEGSVFHIHQHLAIYQDGKPVLIPSDVGRPLAAQCLYWLHTHTPDGIIHVESPTFSAFTLGQFFDIWGQPLSTTVAGPARTRKGGMRVYLDGTLYHGNPRSIELTQHAEITIEVGPPYFTPKPFEAWNGL